MVNKYVYIFDSKVLELPGVTSKVVFDEPAELDAIFTVTNKKDTTFVLSIDKIYKPKERMLGGEKITASRLKVSVVMQKKMNSK